MTKAPFLDQLEEWIDFGFVVHAGRQSRDGAGRSPAGAHTSGRPVRRHGPTPPLLVRRRVPRRRHGRLRRRRRRAAPLQRRRRQPPRPQRQPSFADKIVTASAGHLPPPQIRVPRKSPSRTSARRAYPGANQGVVSAIAVFGEGAGVWGDKCQITGGVSA